MQAEEEDVRPLCKYGKKCYRKNPEHLREYRFWLDILIWISDIVMPLGTPAKKTSNQANAREMLRTSSLLNM